MSTLVRLLLRFNDPRSGRVPVDCRGARTPFYASLRRAIGYVSQGMLYAVPSTLH